MASKDWKLPDAQHKITEEKGLDIENESIQRQWEKTIVSFIRLEDAFSDIDVYDDTEEGEIPYRQYLMRRWLFIHQDKYKNETLKDEDKKKVNELLKTKHIKEDKFMDVIGGFCNNNVGQIDDMAKKLQRRLNKIILLSSIVMIAGIQLGETNLSPEVLAKRKAESEAAAASQAALEAQEAAESASRAAEEEAASKAAQEKAESEAAVATENEIASMKAMILKDCNLSDIPRDDKNQMANADEKNFYAAWKEAAAEKIAEKNQGNNAEDLVRITFEQMVDFYKKIYPDSTLINTEKGILESIDSASSEMEEAKTSDLGYSVEDAELYEGKFYIYKRMETHYDDTLLGSLQKELDSFNTSKAIEWLAYDVDYLMGEAYPGETAYVLITEDEYTFSKQGAYKLTYVDTGKTTELVDDQGFRWEASVYFVVDEDTYNENLQKMFRAEQALYDTYERILNNFGLAE